MDLYRRDNWAAQDGPSVFVDQRTNLTQTAYVVIARLHNVSHAFIKSQLVIDNNLQVAYANWLWSRHDSVRIAEEEFSNDLLPCACDQCLSFWRVEQQIDIEVPSGDCISSTIVDVMVRRQISGTVCYLRIGDITRWMWR